MDESLKDSLRLISAPSRPLSRRIAFGLDARKQRCRVFMMFFSVAWEQKSLQNK